MVPGEAAFWKFVCERQTIWHKRYVVGEPPPWTNDPILQQRHFTNVYRELDYGTRYYLAKIVPLAPYDYHLLWNTITYRLLNSADAWERIGFLPSLEAWQKSPDYRKGYEARLRQIHQEMGKAFYCRAYITLTLAHDHRDRIAKFCGFLTWLAENWMRYWCDVAYARDAQGMCEALTRCPGIGPFTAYEIFSDYAMVKRPNKLDEWANPGPGALAGLELIYTRTNAAMAQRQMRHLRRMQPRCFTDLGLFMPFWEGKPLNLRNIEHSLCEFGKYVKMSCGRGRRQRIFRPREKDEFLDVSV